MAETGLANTFSPYARVLTPQSSPMAMTYAPVRQPSVWDAYRQVLAPTPEPISSAQSAVLGLRFNLEAAFVGGLLGFINGKLGTLDIKGKYPVDGILAALLYALSIRETGKGDGISADLRAMSGHCTAVALFRKADAFARPAVETSGESMSRHTDPLVEAAKKLDIENKEGK